MTDLPDVAEAVRLLQALLPFDSPLGPSTRVVDADLDSLAVLEWMFELDVDPESVFVADQLNGGLLENDDATLGDLYDMFVEAKAAS
jgi:hypothetical protein